MGLTIAADERAPVPRPVWLELVCDGDCGLFRQQCRYDLGDYVKNMTQAKADGWRETEDYRGRIFLCPQCSGKPRNAACV